MRFSNSSPPPPHHTMAITSHRPVLPLQTSLTSLLAITQHMLIPIRYHVMALCTCNPQMTGLLDMYHTRSVRRSHTHHFHLCHTHTSVCSAGLYCCPPMSLRVDVTHCRVVGMPFSSTAVFSASCAMRLYVVHLPPVHNGRTGRVRCVERCGGAFGGSTVRRRQLCP